MDIHLKSSIASFVILLGVLAAAAIGYVGGIYGGSPGALIILFAIVVGWLVVMLVIRYLIR